MAEKAKKSKTAKKTPQKSILKGRVSRTLATAASMTGKAKGLDLIRKVSLTGKQAKMDSFRSGDTVNVYVKVKEGEKERVQVYKGVVTKVQGAGASKSFTVRKMSSGVGVERTFPFLSPVVDRVELLNAGHVRRSRLYYLRELEGKAAKIESDLVIGSESESAPADETPAKKAGKKSESAAETKSEA